MKLYTYLILILFGLTGCGGGGGDDTASAYAPPSQSFSGASYDTWDYVIPSTSKDTNSINSGDIGGTDYGATFTVSETRTTEIPDDAPGEKIVYDKLSDRVKISFYKDDIKTFSYEMKKSIHIGETTTVSDSACVLVNHYSTYNIQGTNYNDVIQIDCGKSKGFYQKGHGEIAQE